ncbi:MAG: tyrosine-type recombinase/integrase [Victivallales bacterium]|nr:tyrosine-type recombinase/integrase [Victivallales bacterium]
MAYLFKPYNTKHWYICWTTRAPGQPTVWHRRTTGCTNREEAEEILRQFRAAQEGRLRRDTIASLLASATGENYLVEVELTDLWDWYGRHCDLTGAAKQQRDRQNKLNAFIAWCQKAHPEIRRVQEITLRIAAEYWQSLANDGAAPSTRNNHLSALNTIWSAIHAPMELPGNPWSAIERDRGGSISYRPFTPAELQALRTTAALFPSTLTEPGFWAAAIEMGYYTGLRLGDIATLDFSELRRDEDFLILIPNKTRRWGDDRVAVHSLSLPWVRLLPEGETGPVWPRASAAYSSLQLSSEFTALAKAAGIQLDREPEEGERRNKVVRLKCFHSLRHTFATDALRRGMSEADLRDQGNWSGTEVIHGHYNHAKLELAKKAARKIARAMLSTEPEKS